MSNITPKPVSVYRLKRSVVAGAPVAYVSFSSWFQKLAFGISEPSPAMMSLRKSQSPPELLIVASVNR